MNKEVVLREAYLEVARKGHFQNDVPYSRYPGIFGRIKKIEDEIDNTVDESKFIDCVARWKKSWFDTIRILKL